MIVQQGNIFVGMVSVFKIVGKINCKICLYKFAAFADANSYTEEVLIL